MVRRNLGLPHRLISKNFNCVIWDNIDKNLAEKLINVSPLNNMNVQKFSLLDAPEDWLKNHPYFRYYANKIIYYRISFPKESTIFEKMKAKPEDEAKMRLYLK